MKLTQGSLSYGRLRYERERERERKRKRERERLKQPLTELIN